MMMMMMMMMMMIDWWVGCLVGWLMHTIRT